MSALAIRRGRARFERLLHPGYSTCYRCDRPWAVVKGHTTMFSESQGCFPLCEICWRELGTPEARWPYYEMHVWDAEGHAGDPQVANAIRAAVFAEAKAS